ncbi:hypothetical protein SSE37_03935 [Sagittula stellata E-37]|uniref:NAD-specific glutamate dehydrogenase n=1 Tax=Sagittula stellata (strain ATCC 700073 / DSM 11524 / E-37) TaxID=388399 RepID=A3K1G7_SAGS3|nr:hypothetical protein SSE37_03935 [Sagittula stellata E-37]
MAQHLGDVFDGDDLQPLLHVVRDFRQILLVFLRDEHRLDATAQGREQFLLQAADGHGVAAQGNLARHRHVLADRDLRQNRHDGCHHRQTGRGTVLRRCAIRHVHVDVDLVELRRLHPDLRRNGPHVARSRIDRLLHHIAQLAGGLHPALARQLQRLDVQEVAADRGPGQPGDDTDLILFLRQPVTVLPDAKELVEVVRRNDHLLRFLLDDLRHRLAGKLGHLAFKVPDAGLPRVVADDVGQRAVLDHELGLLQTVVLGHLVQQVPLGDLKLLVLGVARQRDDLHPVEQRPGHVVAVGGGHEHHVRQVVFHFEIVVHEGRVLFGVQHLQHGRSRIATEVLPHLVDLVEQDERVRGLRLLQRLDDLAGHGADVGPAVAADLGFIAHAAQRNADELAARGLRDRLAQRRLADTRRADEAEDRAFQLLAARLHGEVLDDPLLHLLKRIVVLVEDVLRLVQVLLHARLRAPRDGQHPVEVVAHDGCLGGHGRHVAQLLELRIGLFPGFLRQLGLLDLLFEFGDFALAILAVAEFLLNGFHLLVQIVLALGLLHLALDAGLDLLLDLQDGHLPLHQAIDLLQPLADRERLKQFLLLAHFDAEVTGHEIGQLRRLGRFADGGQRLFGDVLLDLGVALELLRHGVGQGLDRGGVAGHLGQVLGLRLEEVVVVEVLDDAHAALALDQHLHGAVGQLEQLQDIRQHARLVDAGGLRIVDRGIDLAGKQDLLVVVHHLFQCTHRLFAAHEEGHDHVREHDDVAQRQHRIGWIEWLFHARVFLVLGKTAEPRIAATCAVSGQNTLHVPLDPGFQAIRAGARCVALTVTLPARFRKPGFPAKVNDETTWRRPDHPPVA